MKGIILAVVLGVLGTACSNPSVVRADKGALGAIIVQQIYVPRFEGNPNFVEESTDLFIARLEGAVNARVIQGDALRTEGPDIYAGGNLAPTELAIRRAKDAGAQLVVMGKVTSYSSGATLNGFATVRVIDVATGNVVASFHRPSGLLVGNSEHHAVMAAVQRTAEDVAKALR